MRYNRTKRILFLGIIVCTTMFVLSHTASAAFEYKLLEAFPGFFNKDASPEFPAMVEAIYKFGIWTVGIAGLLMMTVGGIMYMGSAGNNATAESAKKIISDSLMGIIVALGAYLFLYVINPNLVYIDINFVSVEVDTFELSEKEQATETAAASTASSIGTGNVPALYQCSPEWGSTQYGSCKGKSTVCSSGCGVVSTAMVLKYYGKSVSAKDFTQKVIDKGGRVCNAGSSATGLAAAAKEYGLESKATTAEVALTKADSNKPVVISVRDCGNNCRFTKGGHFIVVTSKDGDNLTINDPNNAKGSSAKKQITVSQLKSECCLGQGITFN